MERSPDIEVLDGRDAVERLRDPWRALYAAAPEATPFQSWEWNAAWWRQCGGGKRPCVLLVRDGAALIGIAPLYAARHWATPVRRLAWIATGAADYLQPIAAAGRDQEVAAAVARHIRERLGQWHVADLQHAPEHSAFAAAAAAHAGAAAVQRTDACPYVPLPATVEAFEAGLPRKFRQNLAYNERLLHRSFGAVEFALADAATLDESLDALFRLHQRRWRARGLPGVLGGSRVQRLHREAARMALEASMLRLHVLRLDGAPAAALYCLRGHRATCYYIGGFEPALRRFSAGTLLTWRAIRAAIEEGCGEFDFLRGDEPYKARWQPEVRHNCRAVFARRPRGLGGRAGLAMSRAEQTVASMALAYAARRTREGGLGG